jgi:hypothetical protein
MIGIWTAAGRKHNPDQCCADVSYKLREGAGGGYVLPEKQWE